MKIHLPSHANKSSMRRAAKWEIKIVDAMSKPIFIIGSKENETIDRIKREKGESELYDKLHEEYVTLHAKIHDDSLPQFLHKMNKARLR